MRKNLPAPPPTLNGTVVSEERSGLVRVVDETKVCTDGQADLMGLSRGGENKVAYACCESA
jgi:hypothetical protein